MAVNHCLHGDDVAHDLCACMDERMKIPDGQERHAWFTEAGVVEGAAEDEQSPRGSRNTPNRREYAKKKEEKRGQGRVREAQLRCDSAETRATCPIESIVDQPWSAPVPKNTPTPTPERPQ